MEKELNIADILKDKPKGTRLWSPIIGECTYRSYYPSTEDIQVNFTNRHEEDSTWDFHQSGRTLSAPGYAEVCLFPSKSMRSWEKFAWKKGDVLKVATGSDCSCIFDRFTNDDYTEFTGVFDKYLDRFDSFATSDWCKVTDEKEYESIIQRIETQYGGKLNLDTLKIEKPQFKNGDIIKHGKNIYIVQNFTDFYVHIYAGLIGRNGELITRRLGISSNFGCSNLATDSEKQQLFNALAKENKAWDAEKKAIVDLPKKCEFKPKDWCLMRGGSEHINSDWTLCQFSHLMKCGMYRAIGGCAYNECIPYNDQTAHLLGTTDDWKGGEG